MSVDVKNCSKDAHSFIMYGGVFIDKSDNNMPCWAKNNEELEHMNNNDKFDFFSDVNKFEAKVDEGSCLKVACDEISSIEMKLNQALLQKRIYEPSTQSL